MTSDACQTLLINNAGILIFINIRDKWNNKPEKLIWEIGIDIWIFKRYTVNIEYKSSMVSHGNTKNSYKKKEKNIKKLR